MTNNEIEEIKLTVAEEAKEKIDNTLEEDSIFVLSESEGWRIMMRKANKLIVSLLEPIDSGAISDSASLALIGANTLANAKALKVLREFVNEVEVVKKVRRAAILKKQKEEDSKKEA